MTGFCAAAAVVVVVVVVVVDLVLLKDHKHSIQISVDTNSAVDCVEPYGVCKGRETIRSADTNPAEDCVECAREGRQ